MHQGSVLLVEDDVALRRSLKTMLEALGFQVEEAWSGETALAQLRNKKAEAVLLDLNMPGMGGMAACAKLRAMEPALQILVLTVRDHEEDKIAALDAGADDYVTKPFRLPELAARLRSAVRRVRASTDDTQRMLELGPFSLDPAAHKITRHGEELHLTPKEFELLHLLMRHAGRPLSHTQLLTQVWGPEYGNEREYLRTYVSQLRRKLEEDPASPRYLTTENYVGYRFQVE
ncbi:MAG: response regulator transcription factor [Acidobacteriaceae bacterium]|nr:response regulator transcription factor [Acidobacteriaceae bacterium]